MSAGHRFLGLHYFHRIGHARAEPIARLEKRLFRQINIAAGHIHLICRRLEIQQRGANVRVDLRPQIVQAFTGLLKSAIGLQNRGSVRAEPEPEECRRERCFPERWESTGFHVRRILA